jgi:dolichol kinase
VAAIGDDRNNLKLLERAGVSIGFRAAYAVRRRVRFLVDGDDFAAVIPFVERSPGPPHPPRRHRAGKPEPERTWRQELRRKAVHACAALAVPLHRARPPWVLGFLTGAAMLYLVGEFFRLNGMSFPILSRVERWTLRRGERRRLALAPITLAAGVVLPLLCFPPAAAYVAVLIVAFGDSVASVVGRHWGRHPLPHNPYKTLEGSLVAFVAAVLCASVYLPFPSAMLIGVVASLIESLDLGDWDNLLIPLGAGLTATFLLPG